MTHMWKTAPLDEFAFALDIVDSLDSWARFDVTFMKIVFRPVFPFRISQPFI